MSWLNNRPMTIAIIGPDGCGKSTVLNYLNKELRCASISVRYEHLRPNWLPALSVLRRSRKPHPQEWEQTDRPHAAPQVGSLSSAFRWGYYGLDYFFGFWFKTQQQDTDIVLFDRYFYDFMIDPRRSRLRKIPFLLKVFWQMLPRPNKTFYLDASVDILLSRKQEVEKDELIQMVERYRAFAQESDNIMVINAELTPEVLGNQILEEITQLKKA